MNVDKNAEAAIFFNQEGRAMVTYRSNASLMPLLATPYAENSENCIVYMDQEHTRGTDLKFPPCAKAALTLGPGQTKDATVQAAMRMRLLGVSQSVSWFAPPEVDQSIRDTCGVPKGRLNDRLNSSHVVKWILEQSCSAVELLQPLYYSQGTDYCRRTRAAENFADFVNDPTDRQDFLRVVRMAEHHTLKYLYHPSSKKSVAQPKEGGITLSALTRPFVKRLKEIKRGFIDTGVAVSAGCHQEVELELEQQKEVDVSYEIQSTRDVRKPHWQDAHHWEGLNGDVEEFVRTGRLRNHSPAIHSAAFFLGHKTVLGRKHGIRQDAFSGNLFVSREFVRTIKALNDNYLVRRRINKTSFD
jgi:hypothetical protein